MWLDDGMTTKCPGTGRPAVSHPGDVYPYCSDCGKQMAAQGRKARLRYVGAWTSVPVHMVDANERDNLNYEYGL